MDNRPKRYSLILISTQALRELVRNQSPLHHNVQVIYALQSPDPVDYSLPHRLVPQNAALHERLGISAHRLTRYPPR